MKDSHPRKRILSYFEEADDTATHRVTQTAHSHNPSLRREASTPRRRPLTPSEQQARCATSFRRIHRRALGIYIPRTLRSTRGLPWLDIEENPAESTEPATILRGRRLQQKTVARTSLTSNPTHPPRPDSRDPLLHTPAPPIPQSLRLFDLKGSFDAAVMRILVDAEYPALIYARHRSPPSGIE
ncbi:hypothetical protein B0H13DRAFT_2499420 [Mycena leptocephala]|nr:hypothetical protein B0H13DRAFT_2499420 [Mycena leptocephala]